MHLRIVDQSSAKHWHACASVISDAEAVEAGVGSGGEADLDGLEQSSIPEEAEKLDHLVPEKW